MFFKQEKLLMSSVNLQINDKCNKKKTPKIQYRVLMDYIPKKIHREKTERIL